jgi:MSHA pilin protein MshD
MCTKSLLVPQRGVSLVELIMFILIVSISAAGILLVMNQVTSHSADPLIRKQAMAIAESMLEEVELQGLDPAACTGALTQNANRTRAGCVNDYNGYSTSNGILDYATNTGVGGLGGYNIAGVAVTPITNLGGQAVQAGSAVEITVTVTDPLTPSDGVRVQATGYRAGN